MTTLAEISRPAPGGYREVTPAELAQAGYSGRIIDVREPAEFNAELGHLERAELVPLATVPARAADWDRDAELVVVCRSGGRSSRAAQLLAGMGFRRLYNLTGGMLAAAALPGRRT